ncbi:MAG TPA: hypothetical protein VFS21_40135 [Roseiflexaceae bacterium]|nr:hypothetical protein [Roseiflexaceae bacterium]
MRESQAHRQRPTIVLPPQTTTVLTTLVLTGAVFGVLILARDTFDPLARQARALELAQHQTLVHQAAPAAVIAAALWQLIPPILLLGAGLLLFAVAWRRWVQPLPPRQELISVVAAPAPTTVITQPAEAIPAQIAAPAAPAAPTALSSTASSSSTTSAPPALDHVARELPTFRQLLEAGEIGPRPDGRKQPILLGLDAATGAPITGTWRELYSAGLGGLQGSGKTWTAATLLAQSALNGARLIIADPHAGDAESLAQRCAPLAPALLCDIAEDDRAILRALELAQDELERRKTGKSAERWPLIIAIDEWTALRRGELGERLPEIVESIATEGRKLEIHALLLAQRWDKESAGGFRNTLSAAYIHRMRPAEARMLTGLPASYLPADVLQLAPGSAYLLSTRGELRRVVTPLTTPADLAAVGARLQAASAPAAGVPVGEARAGRLNWIVSLMDDYPEESSHTQAERRPLGFRPPAIEPAATAETQKPTTPADSSLKPTRNPDETQVRNPENLIGTAQELPAETARVLALFREEKSIGEIVKAIYGDVSGPRYNRLRDEVEAMIRRHWSAVQTA